MPGVRVADDLVKRQFRPQAPNVMWFTDITYLRTWEGWFYPAAVQDTFSRRIVGWQIAEHMRTELVVDALQIAVSQRRPDPGLIHHSDQGSQFVSLGFGQAAAKAGISRSMGSKGVLLGQRRRRNVLRNPQEGARLPPLLANPPGARDGRVRLHRGVLNPTAPAHHPRDALPDRVREPSSRRCSVLNHYLSVKISNNNHQPRNQSPVRSSGIPPKRTADTLQRNNTCSLSASDRNTAIHGAIPAPDSPITAERTQFGNAALWWIQASA